VLCPLAVVFVVICHSAYEVCVVCVGMFYNLSKYRIKTGHQCGDMKECFVLCADGSIFHSVMCYVVNVNKLIFLINNQ
jgi:hypothetical protein